MDNVKVDISVEMSNMQLGTQDGRADHQDSRRYDPTVTLYSSGNYILRVWVRRDGQLLKTQDFKFSV